MTLISNINKKIIKLINYLEKKIISTKDEFELNKKELKEIKRDF